jgi:hypothetical protein
MTRSLSVLPFALFLAAAYPGLGRADDPADQCRKMAVEEEVAPEDMEDYIAECLAVVQSETPEDAADAMAPPDETAPEPGSAPDAAPVAAPVAAPGAAPGATAPAAPQTAPETKK